MNTPHTYHDFPNMIHIYIVIPHLLHSILMSCISLDYCILLLSPSFRNFRYGQFGFGS